MKEKVFGVFQRVGRSFMLPIALLPVAGLLLGIGSSFTNENMLAAYNLNHVIFPGGILYTILDIMKQCGSAVFDNLALLFAMGVAIGMAKKEKEVAGLSGAVAYLVMNTSISAMITARGGVEAMAEHSTASVLGITTLQMGVFGGIIVGLGVAALHNRFYKAELPQVLSFFGGTRFVPIISTAVYLVVGIAMFYIWPIFQEGISMLGALVTDAGYAGTWIYGIIKRSLIPFGLHHVFYMPFWQTALGGTAFIDGVLVQGAQNIFFAELASKSTEVFSSEATRFMSGEFTFMIFGLPGAALAMYRCAKPEKRKAVGSLLLSATMTCILTGITEPLEFTFLFVAPILYVIHCFFGGTAYMLMHMLDVGVGLTFSGGLIDMTLFGILQGNDKTNWIWIVIVGIIYFFIYYAIFTFMIKKFNLKTPGREDDGEETKLYTRSDFKDKTGIGPDGSAPGLSDANDRVSALIVGGLGGKANISDVDCCATRLRITVFDEEKVDDKQLKQSGASGVIHKGNGIQVIYGPQVAVIKSNLEEYMEKAPEEQQAAAFEAGEIDEKAGAAGGIDEKAGAAGGIDEKAGAAGEIDEKAGAAGEIDEKAGKLSETEAKDEAAERDVIGAHMNGSVVKMADVPDEAFASGALGEGIAVEPSEGKLYAPCDAEIEAVFDTKHAVSMTADTGAEILLHIGIDTVKLNGEFFTVHVEDGQKVKKGDLLISFDMEGISKAGYPLVTPMTVCNSEEYALVEPVDVDTVKAGEDMIELQK